MSASLVTRGMIATGAADGTAPTITDVSPAPGTELDKDTPVTFTVEDVAPGLQYVLVTLRYVSRPGTFVVHDGAAFRYPFDSGASDRVATVDGYDFTVLPRGGWLDDIEELRVLAFDSAGNVMESTP